ncbi:MAG: cobalamin-dependent protein, partial [Candidatus Heimdallarchaeota archaeon]|nr:cobalamin-dependent protein [Candidatus Heimdallarchaeota archaeon]
DNLSPYVQVSSDRIKSLFLHTSGITEFPDDIEEQFLKSVDPLQLIRRAEIGEEKLERFHFNSPVDTSVLLICPDSGENIPDSKPHNIALGPRRIASYLNHKGIKTAVVDFCIHDRKSYRNFIEQNQPPIIAFSILYPTLEQDLHNIWQARQLCPDSLIVIGGIEATNNSDEYIRKLPIDVLVLGEGEMPLLKMGKIVESNKTIANEKDELLRLLQRIPGLKIKFEDNHITKTGPAKILTSEQYNEVFNANQFYLTEYEAYWNQSNMAGLNDEDYGVMERRVVRIPTANCCSFNCSFCAGPKFLRNASEEKIVPLRKICPEMMVEKVKQVLSIDSTLA